MTVLSFENIFPLLPTKETHNSSNHWQLCPFVVQNNVLFVQKEWWDTELLPVSKDILLCEIVDRKGLQISVVDELPPDASKEQDELFWFIYNVHLRQYDAQHWTDFLDQRDFKLINLPKSLIENLHILTTLFVSGRPMNKEIVSEIQEMSSWKRILASIEKNGVFVKLGQTSGKHDHAIRPIHNQEELLQFLCDSRDFLKCYDSYLTGNTFPIFILIQPWNRLINDSNEFRIFYYQGKVTAISQQKWYQVLQFDDVKQICETLIKTVQSSKIPYSCAVIDMFYDNSTSNAHIIEFNPWGAWNASGSALFHWIQDYSVLYSDEDNCVCRIYSNSN